MSDILDKMISNHTKLANQFKREAKKCFVGDEVLIPQGFLNYRYHHGYAEGLKMAKKIMEAENGKD